MPQQELLKVVVDKLTDLGIPYMMTGSMVSSLQGEPRASHDMDFVVVIAPGQVDQLMQAFPAPEYYLSRDAIADALRTRAMFNLLSMSEGEKVDFWQLTDEPFDVSRFSRKRAELVGGTPVMVSSPEDTILAKLRWAKMSGGSNKQITDSLRVYEVQRAKLDMDYLSQWANQLDVADLWEKIQKDAEPL
jgi:hypothetical protein